MKEKSIKLIREQDQNVIMFKTIILCQNYNIHFVSLNNMRMIYYLLLINCGYRYYIMAIDKLIKKMFNYVLYYHVHFFFFENRKYLYKQHTNYDN